MDECKPLARGVAAQPPPQTCSVSRCGPGVRPLVCAAGRGLHSFTFQLNVRAFCRTGDGCRRWEWDVEGGIRGF